MMSKFFALVSGSWAQRQEESGQRQDVTLETTARSLENYPVMSRDWIPDCWCRRCPVAEWRGLCPVAANQAVASGVERFPAVACSAANYSEQCLADSPGERLDSHRVATAAFRSARSSLVDWPREVR